MPSVIPAGQYKKFSEIRARHLLNALTDLGPRPSGSKACEVCIFFSFVYFNVTCCYLSLCSEFLTKNFNYPLGGCS